MTTGSPLNTNVNAPGSADRARAAARASQATGPSASSLHDLPTVVLLNGRRLPNSGLGADASVDLNTLPMSFIERVEVLASGASAAVGADAVGGVVNIVTRRNNHGLELSGTRTITERGDGEIVTGQAAIGFDLLGGAWSLGVDYVEQDGVTMDRRSYSALPLIIVDGSGTVKPDGLNNMAANGYFDVPEGNALGLEPGIYTRVPGATGQTSADYRPYDRSIDGFNPAPFNYSQTPNERASLWLLGSRPLGESANLFLEAFVHHRESAQQAAPAFYSDGSSSVPTDTGPSGRQLLQPLRGRPAAYLAPPGRGRQPQDRAGGRSVARADRARRQRRPLDVGARAPGRPAETTGVEKGFLALSRLASALGPSGLDDSGRIVCGSPDPATGRVPAASIIPDCVPLNHLRRSGEHHGGTAGIRDSGDDDQSRHERAAIRGVGPERPGWADAGQGRAVGAGCRVPARSRQPGAGSAMCLPTILQTCFGTTPEVSGAYDARELFAAVQVPLLHDRPWARDMALNIGLRWSDFSSFDSHTTWQAGLRWQLAEELTLRANYSEVFRAPSLAELYERPLELEQFALDPCGNDPTPTQQANCAANGVPGGAYVQDGWGVIAVLWRQPGARAGDGAHARSRPGLHPGVGQGAFRKRRLLPGEPVQLHLSRVSRRDTVRVRGAWR